MGYSLLFKRIIFKSHTYFANLDLVFGLISLSILSIFINFFSPLKYFQLVILILGFIFGFAMGWGQMMRGAHFMSHNLWTGLIVWMVLLAQYLAWPPKTQAL